MANSRIEDLTAAGALDGDELLYAIQGGNDRKATVSQIQTFLQGNGLRELLTADRTYYVRTDGSDSNDGTANTAGGAWLTIQYGIDWISQNIDFGGTNYTVYLQVGNGTYDEHLVLKPLVGAASTQGFYNQFIVTGDLGQADYTQVVIRPTTVAGGFTGNHIIFGYGIQGYEFWYIHFDGRDAGYNGGASTLVELLHSRVTLDTCGLSSPGGYDMVFLATCTGSMNSLFFNIASQVNSIFLLQRDSTIYSFGVMTLVSGSPTFVSGFYDLDLLSKIFTSGVSFSGWGSIDSRPYKLTRGSGIARLGPVNSIPGIREPLVDATSFYSPVFGALVPGYGNGTRYQLNAPLTYYVRTVPVTVTMTIATPAVVTWTGHPLQHTDSVVFNTTGALPTGVTAGTIYYVISSGLTADTFQFSTSVGGAAVNTSGTQSGTHSAQTGNDLNNGLQQDVTRIPGISPSSTVQGLGPFLTIQGAVEYVGKTVDLGQHYSVAVQCADGIYQEQLLLSPVVGAGGSWGQWDTDDAGQIFIIGNEADHNAVTIRPVTAGFENAIVYANQVSPGWQFWYIHFDGSDTTFSAGPNDNLIELHNSWVSFFECEFTIDDSGTKDHIFGLVRSGGYFNTLDFNVNGTINSIFTLNQRALAYSTGVMTLLSGTPVMTEGFYSVDDSTFRLESVSWSGWGTIDCRPYTLSEMASLNTIFTSGYPGTRLPYVDTTSTVTGRHGWISPFETQAVSGSIGFKQDTTTSNAEIGSSIHSVATDTTGGSEDFYLSFRNMNAGATAAELMRLEKTAVAGDTALMLYDVDNNTVERVSVGVADSGGAGFKVLRIPN